MKLIILLILLNLSLTGFSQATVRASVGVTIISVNDLKTDSLGNIVLDDSGYAILKTEAIPVLNVNTIVLIGYNQVDVLKIKGEPLSKIDILYSGKQKWIYDDFAYYFNESKVELIQKIK